MASIGVWTDVNSSLTAVGNPATGNDGVTDGVVL